jgi:hypothetical protein
MPIPSSLLLLFQQPESEKHQENQYACCAKEKACQEFLNWSKEAHANSDDEVDYVEENQVVNSFIHDVFFICGKYRN